MEQYKFENINKIPVRTYRWLQVNDTTLKDVYLPEHQKYNKDYKPTSAPLGISVQSSLDNVIFIKDNQEYIYGISKELTLSAEQQHNSGLVIQSQRDVKTSEPLVINYTSDSNNNVIIDKNVIIAEEDSSMTIIMNYSSQDNSAAFHNGITKIYAKSGSKVTVIKVQSFNNSSNHFDAILALVNDNAQVNVISIDLGGKNSITSNHTYLIGENASSFADTVYFGDGKRYIDMNYVTSHRGRRVNGNILVKGVLMDECKKLFRGTIDFKKGASRSKGKEEEYCMLLSPKAKSHAVPLLLCDEDDVEGEHAASAGRIDEDKLFYLMSRGFNEIEAKKIFIEASFAPILDKIPLEDLRTSIKEEIERRLKNEG